MGIEPATRREEWGLTATTLTCSMAYHPRLLPDTGRQYLRCIRPMHRAILPTN